MKKLRSKKQSETLGMDYGTAYNVLRKKILFMLVQKANMAICHRCKEELTDPDTMEIDHIEDWETSDNPLENFLDVGNIAFSHSICNNLAKTSKRVGKSGYIGVLHTKNKKNPYTARIRDKGKQRIIGNFSIAKEAAIAYDNEVIKLHGNKAITNQKMGYLQ
ncbi:HNH endonuclease [Bacillus mobilis]|uniref:HNH endonuclease n=1 Tax=Bacillus mobilis TaxID=2026190 RepID=UPI003D06B6CA